MKIKSHYLLLGLSLWQFLLFFVVISSFQIHFQSIKDVEMILNLSAKFLADSSNPFVFHTHILMSQLLKNLYNFGNLDWYSYFLFGILGISFVVISFKICRYRQDWRGFLLIFLFSIVLEIPILTKLNFEVVAGILTIAATVIILPKQSNKINIGQYLLGFSFLLFAFLLSSTAFILISIPCFLFVFSQTNKKYFRQTMLNLFVLMMLVLGTITADWYNENVYRAKKSWHIYREMQQLSQKLQQIDIETCNQDPDCEATLAKLNWTLNDFRILQNGFAFPNETFSNFKIKTFIAEAHLDYTQKHKTKESEHDLLIKKNYTYLIISSLCLFLFALLLYFQNYKRILKITFFAILIIILSVLGIYFLNLSIYLLTPLWILLAILPTLWTIPPTQKEKSFELKKLNKFQLLALSFLTMLILLQITATLFNQRTKTKNTSYQFEDTIMLKNISKNPNNLYILWETEIPLNEINPFENIAKNQKNIFWLHKYQQSPALQSRLKDFQIKDLYKNLVEKNNVFLVIDNKKFKKLSKIYKLYISEHYDLLIKFERQNEENEKYGIYKMDFR